jgi:hypothetical protein
MGVHLATAWTNGRILLIFGIYEIIDHGSVPGEHEHSSSKNSVPSQLSSNTKNTFSLNGCNEYGWTSAIYGNHLPK